MWASNAELLAIRYFGSAIGRTFVDKTLARNMVTVTARPWPGAMNSAGTESQLGQGPLGASDGNHTFTEEKSPFQPGQTARDPEIDGQAAYLPDFPLRYQRMLLLNTSSPIAPTWSTFRVMAARSTTIPCMADPLGLNRDVQRRQSPTNGQ